jgi:undecaprenyl-diphosphatase
VLEERVAGAIVGAALGNRNRRCAAGVVTRLGARRRRGRRLRATARDERSQRKRPDHAFDVSVSGAMALWFAALLGLVQGLTEFIPVSSTAHLRVVPALFGQADPGAAYTAVIQLGTLAAVLAYFAKDLAALPAAMMRDPGSFEGRLPWLLAVGTVPIVIAGLLLKKQIEGDLRSLYVIATALIVVGIIMAVVDHFAGGRANPRPLASITLTDALLVGLAQSLALVPGVSRSGATICMILLLGFSRSDSARFSFLLSIPAIAGAGLFEARDAFRQLGQSAIPALAVGTSVAAITGYMSIAWLIRFLGSNTLVGFAVYRVACGAALLVALAQGFLRRV